MNQPIPIRPGTAYHLFGDSAWYGFSVYQVPSVRYKILVSSRVIPTSKEMPSSIQITMAFILILLPNDLDMDVAIEKSVRVFYKRLCVRELKDA